ncbi:MAG: phosphate acyltransferase PlsX [Bacteroidetes bacterium]|nr:phosphate acyltransferase PlsX [Bacteroidota bacterium]MBU1114623.1 phosphate acyltransferase PlsX [Bacteroidota bacterium]MBU1797807.1 phosphate acyltransferase PlsX [Bacteroidota bacterium]
MTNNTNSKCVIAIDAMGGDFAPLNAVVGAIEAFNETKDFDLFLVGKKDEIEEVIKNNNLVFNSDFIVHASQVIDMHDHPTETMKTKPNSSMAIGAKLVKDGKAHAFVSAGNTGAMVVNSIFGMGRIKGVSRPTLTAPLPNAKDGFTFLADVGAFVDSKPQHIFEFALLSSIFLREIYGIKEPRVGLMNVGSEDSKGYKLTLDTAELLQNSNLNFIGNVEGNDIFKGTADLIVCDGFIGNILLKFAESMPSFLKAAIKNYANKSILNKLKVSPFKFPPTKAAFKESLSKADADNVGGLPLLGVNGISIIGHGSSSTLAIKNMVLAAREMHNKNLIFKIKEELSRYAEQK